MRSLRNCGKALSDPRSQRRQLHDHLHAHARLRTNTPTHPHARRIHTLAEAAHQRQRTQLTAPVSPRAAQPATSSRAMRSGRPSFIVQPVKSMKALEDIQNLLAGTCPAPPTDEVTAANVGSRSNTFAAAEGAPTHPAPSLWPLLPEPEPKAATGSLAACSLPGDARVSRTHPTLPLPTHGLPPFVPWPCSLWRCLLCRHQGVLGRDPAQRRDAGARGGGPAEREGELPHLHRSALRVLRCQDGPL